MKMAKTLEQIIAETGKVPPEQTMRDEDELIAEIGRTAYMKEYHRLALKRMAEHGHVVPEEVQNEDCL